MSAYNNSFLAILGATSLSELVTHPFEVTKVRSQIKFSRSGVLPPRFHIFKDYVNKYGFKALYRGFSAGIFRAIQNQTIRLYLYDFINRLVPKASEPQTPLQEIPRKFFSAFVSSFAAGLTGNPWVVLKVRMIADRTGEYTSLKKSCKKIIKDDGYREFTKGTSITIARGILMSTVELTAYDTLKQVFVPFLNNSKTQAFFVASLVSSFLAAFCSYPLDVIITLYMNEHSKGQTENRGLQNVWRICREIRAKNGLRGFYVGFSGFASRSMVYGPVFWNSLEFFNRLSNKEVFEF